MPKIYDNLLAGNRAWHDQMIELDPDYFAKLATGQQPQFLFIGCADSRVPANIITNTYAGDMFVHRNIANLCVDTDLNMLSVLQYAVDVLQVKHIIVCGHYGCGGIKAAMGSQSVGMINHWLNAIKKVYVQHDAELDAIADENQRIRRLTELSVKQSVINLCKTNIVQRAWKTRDGYPMVHGWVYGIEDGLIKELDIRMSSAEDLHPMYRYDNG